MASAVHQFFSPWEPAPPQVHAPADPALTDRINMLVKYAVQNGPSFLSLMREKQASEPQFAFLFGGDGAAYFRWSLWSAASNAPAAPVDQVMSEQAPAPVSAPWGQPQTQPHTQPQAQLPDRQEQPTAVQFTAELPAEVESSFGQVLDMLSGSKDSIKSSQQWFMKCLPYAGGLARVMARRVIGLDDYDKQLHIIYLANDILFKSLAQRAAEGGGVTVAPAFEPVLPALLAAAYNQGGRKDEVKGRLQKILNFWAERHVFEASAISKMEDAMTTTVNPASLLIQDLVKWDQQAAAAAARAAQAQAAAASQQAATHHSAAPTPPAHGGAAGSGWGVSGNADVQAPHAAGPTAYQYPPSVAGGGAMQQLHSSAYPAGSLPNPPAPWQPSPAPWAQNAPHVAPSQPGAAPWNGAAAPPLHPAHQYPSAAPPASGPAAAWPAPGPPHQYLSHQHHMAPPPAYGAPRPPVGWYPPPGALPVLPQQPAMVPGAYPGGPPPYAGPYAGPGVASSQQGPVAPPAPPPAAAPQPEPVSSLSFPPGLLPKLIKDKSRHSESYSPMDQEDIEATGLPPPPEKTNYLLSRMERFYADIRDYRPGVSVADLLPPGDPLVSKGAAGREHHRDHQNDCHPGGRGRIPRAGFSDADDGGGGRGRGRGRGQQESMYAGLGSHTYHRSRSEVDGDTVAATSQAAASKAPTAAKAEGMSDMYLSYRKARSGVYHDTIVRGPFSGRAR